MLADADSHPFSECTTKDEVVTTYLQQLDDIKEIVQQKYGIETDDFVEMFGTEFVNERCCTTPISHNAHSNGVQKIRQLPVHYMNMCSMKYVYSQLKRYATLIVAFCAVLAIVLILVNYRCEFTKLFMRNIQVYIYPGMRMWRKLTLPIIRQFPQLTQLYDETCLVTNPLFRVANLDCTPCADVINVVDLSIAPHYGYLDNSIPHIVEQVDGINQTIAQIHQLYQQNRKIFRHEAYKVHSTDVNIGNLDQLFDVMLNSSKKRAQTRSHTLWRINRMTPARLLRALFPSPKTIPLHAGIDIERYIAFDVNGGVTYQLPSTDCSNMFVYQAIGSRVIHLQPTSECRQQCRRITVQLKQNHTLFYDWWYWKPISLPADRLLKSTSVSYIGSYC